MSEKQGSLWLKVAAFLVSIAVLASELIAETSQIELGEPCGASIIFTLPMMHCVPQHFASTLFSISPCYYIRPLQFFPLFLVRGGRGGGVETWYSVGNEKMLNETNRCKTQETSRILITHLLRTVPDLVNTYLLSMRALCTSISIFWPLEKMRAFQLTLAFAVALSG